MIRKGSISPPSHSDGPNLDIPESTIWTVLCSQRRTALTGKRQQTERSRVPHEL